MVPGTITIKPISNSSSGYDATKPDAKLSIVALPEYREVHGCFSRDLYRGKAKAAGACERGINLYR